MDHLPIPDSANRDSTHRIPYNCRERYDGGPFLTYPMRIDPPRPYLTHPVNYDDFGFFHPDRRALFKDDEEACGFLQNWLIFGLLHEVLGDFFNEEDFVTEENQQKYLTTVKLPKIAQEWAVQLQNHPMELKSQRYDHIAECLRLVREVLMFVWRFQRMFPQVATNKTSFSVSAIAELLADATDLMMEIDETRPSKCRYDYRLGHVLSESQNQMRENGWCPKQIKHFTDNLEGVSCFYYLSQLKRSGSTENHADCSDHNCTATHIVSTDHLPRHSVEGCSCAHVQTNLEDMSNVFLTGSFPVLKVSWRNEDPLDISVRCELPSGPYVAVSHVWSQGLGNPWENALPQCQLHRLGKLAASIRDKQRSITSDKVPVEVENPASNDISIWIDTMCCPLGSTETRRAALSLMAQVYREACAVLIVDDSIRCYDTRTMSVAEALTRLIVSPWTTRLWTLQEATFAKDLWFEFSNTVLSESETIFLILRMPEERLKFFDLRRTLGYEYSKIKLHDHAQSLDIDAIGAAVKMRTTSKLADEPICLATLLQLDVSRILKVLPGYSRMAAFWWLVSETPKGIPTAVVFNSGPRLTVRGCWWAPSTLLDRKSDLHYTFKYGSGTLAEAGLKVRLPGLKIAPIHDKPDPAFETVWMTNYSPPQRSFFLRETETKWSNVISTKYVHPEDQNRDLWESCDISSGIIVLLYLEHDDLHHSQPGLLGKIHQDGTNAPAFETYHVVEKIPYSEEQSFRLERTLRWACTIGLNEFAQNILKQEEVVAQLQTFVQESEAGTKGLEEAYSFFKVIMSNDTFIEMLNEVDVHPDIVNFPAALQFFLTERCCATHEHFESSQEWCIM